MPPRDRLTDFLNTQAHLQQTILSLSKDEQRAVDREMVAGRKPLHPGLRQHGGQELLSLGAGQPGDTVGLVLGVQAGEDVEKVLFVDVRHASAARGRVHA